MSLCQKSFYHRVSCCIYLFVCMFQFLYALHLLNACRWDKKSWLNNESKKNHRSIVQSLEAMRLCSVKIDAISAFQNQDLVADHHFKASFGHHVELLSFMRVLRVPFTVRKRVNLH